MTCFFFVIFGLFYQKAPFSIKKNSPFRHQNFPLFLIMVSVDHISFSSAGTGPLHIKWHEIYASVQTGTGPRSTHGGPQGKSELCVLIADSTSDHWSLYGKERVYDVCVCECLWRGEGERERRRGGGVVCCAVRVDVVSVV